MLNPTEKLRAQFAPDDRVGMISRGRMKEGIVVRTNPKRALVRFGEEEYHVPYKLLIALGGSSRLREERMEATLQWALDLIRQHGLETWRFMFDHGTRRAGCCNYHDKTISISFELARNGADEDIRDTILHEMAHALVGKKHNHDAVWKAKALALGCSGERTHRLQFAPPRYHVACENRCWKRTAQRRQRSLVCRTCGGQLIYTPYAAQ